jgi:hypothetical protein
MAVLPGGIAIVTALGLAARWHTRWPLDLTWGALAFGLVFPLLVGHRALWREDTPREQLTHACVLLLLASYMVATSALLLVREALTRIR